MAGFYGSSICLEYTLQEVNEWLTIPIGWKLAVFSRSVEDDSSVGL